MNTEFKAQVIVTGVKAIVNRNGKIREYALTVASFIRLYKMQYQTVPVSHRFSQYHGFMFYWIHQRNMINWRPQYRATRGGYWNAYHDISDAWYGEGSKYNQRRAFQYALKYYGWTVKKYNDADDTMCERMANTQ